MGVLSSDREVRAVSAIGDGQPAAGFLSPAKYGIAAFIQSCETRPGSHAQRVLVFIFAEGAIERGMLIRPIGRSILPHDIDVRI